MSSNVTQILLEAVRKARGPLEEIITPVSTLAGEIQRTEKSLRELNSKASRLEAFRKTNAQLTATNSQLAHARKRVNDLNVAMRSGVAPTEAQVKAMNAAGRVAANLEARQRRLTNTLMSQRRELSRDGIKTRSSRQLGEEQQRLQKSIDSTRERLGQQRISQAGSQVMTGRKRQKRLNRRHNANKALASKWSDRGSSKLDNAVKIGSATVSVLKPGFDFSAARSELQSALGLEKTSPQLEALRHQARQLGDDTAASPADAARAQLVAARTGADPDGILAQTPAILKLSLASNKTVEESAGLLASMKETFGLADDQSMHIADALATAIGESKFTFDELSDSLAQVMPAAQKAGLGLEETTAMLSVLRDAGITDEMNGTGAKNTVGRLQSPTGEASAALKKLGVKSTDSEGKQRPIFAILKDIQSSFEKNNLSTAQREKYTQTIFGAEGSESAGALMGAAASGQLERRAAQISASQGAVEKILHTQTDNLGGDLMKLQSAYEAIGTDLFNQNEPLLRRLVQAATNFLWKLDEWIKKNKTLVQTLSVIAAAAVGISGVSGAIGMVAGSVFSHITTVIGVASRLGMIFRVVGSVIMTVLGGLTWPIVAIVAAIIAGALLIRKFWEPISAFFGGFIEGLSEGFAPLAELFSPLVEKLKEVWELFGQWLEPIKFSSEALDGCRSAGTLFGKAMVDAILMPLHLFNELNSATRWLLEKVGIIKTTGKPDESAGKGDDATPDGSSIAPTSSGPGYQDYKPTSVTLPRTFVDQSKSDININIQGNNSSDEKIARKVREALEQHEQDKRSRARGSMIYSG